MNLVKFDLCALISLMISGLCKVAFRFQLIFRNHEACQKLISPVSLSGVCMGTRGSLLSPRDSVWWKVGHTVKGEATHYHQLRLSKYLWQEAGLLLCCLQGTHITSCKPSDPILWRVAMQVVDDESVILKHTLTGHQKPVSFVSWSPDSTMLLTSGNEEVVKLWDICTGTCKHTYDKPSSCFTSCAWFPDGHRFVLGGRDKCIYMWDLEVWALLPRIGSPQQIGQPCCLNIGS
jgi:hypothetical protein